MPLVCVSQKLFGSPRSTSPAAVLATLTRKVTCMWTQIGEDTFKLHLEECGLANGDLVRNGFLGGSDCLSQGWQQGQCMVWLRNGLCSGKGAEETPSVCMAAGRRAKSGQDGWDQRTKDLGHQRRGLNSVIVQSVGSYGRW